MGNQLPQQVKARIEGLRDTYGAKQGMNRRDFLKTSFGMATTFLAMNNVYGNVFKVSETEADTVMATEHTETLRQPFIFDVETYFEDSFLGLLQQASTDPMTAIEFENYVRLRSLVGSDTDVDLVCGVLPGDDGLREFPDRITEAVGITEAVRRINTLAGHARMLAQAAVTPGQPGWMDAVNQALAEHPPACWGLYTFGDTLSPKAGHPFWISDEKLMYPFYERAAEAGINNLCIHNGRMSKNYIENWEDATVGGLAKAATDWPQLNFIIYHCAFLPDPSEPLSELDHFERTGRIERCSDLAEIPSQNGASNIYAETGPPLVYAMLVNPRLAAAILGILIRGLGASNVVWGTGSVFSNPGNVLWSIEAMRRMEIPEDMQEKYGFAPLGGADSTVKQQIFGLNSARLYETQLGIR